MPVYYRKYLLLLFLLIICTAFKNNQSNDDILFDSRHAARFIQMHAETGEYTLIVPKGFKLLHSSHENKLPVKESPFDYQLEKGGSYIEARAFKLNDVNCRIIIYNTFGENDTKVLNIQLNTYDQYNNLKDALLLDSRYSAENLYYNEFIVFQDGTVDIRQFKKTQFIYNEQGDILSEAKNVAPKITKVRYSLAANGTLIKSKI
jgi:hypothetical protein